MHEEELIKIDESIREIASLDELYSELVKSRPKNREDAHLKQEEAKFARDRVLKHSLNVRRMISRIGRDLKIK